MTEKKIGPPRNPVEKKAVPAGKNPDSGGKRPSAGKSPNDDGACPASEVKQAAAKKTTAVKEKAANPASSSAQSSANEKQEAALKKSSANHSAGSKPSDAEAEGRSPKIIPAAKKNTPEPKTPPSPFPGKLTIPRKNSPPRGEKKFPAAEEKQSAALATQPSEIIQQPASPEKLEAEAARAEKIIALKRKVHRDIFDKCLEKHFVSSMKEMDTWESNSYDDDDA